MTDNQYMYNKLDDHFGHTLCVCRYGPKNKPLSITLECVDCCEVIQEYDREE